MRIVDTKRLGGDIVRAVETRNLEWSGRAIIRTRNRPYTIILRDVVLLVGARKCVERKMLAEFLIGPDHNGAVLLMEIVFILRQVAPVNTVAARIFHPRRRHLEDIENIPIPL